MTGEKVLGIDLGTTNTAFAIIEGGEPTVIPNREGDRTTPSVVAFQGDEVLVGTHAENQKANNPEKTITSIKRKMGRGDYTVTIGSDEYTPQEISAFILRKVKEDAEEYLGEEINRCVITVPAYFKERQRKATIEAGEIAGFNVERIINEPTAAAIAYGIDDDRQQKVLIFDLGGGTFDVSLLDLGDGVYDVIATNGDSHLGGDDWDEELVDYFAEKFKEDEGINLRTRPHAKARLYDKSEEAKRTLSTSINETVSIPFITKDENNESLSLSYNITRNQFEHLTRPLVEKLDDPVERVLLDAGVNEQDIDEVILVGGSTRMPMVREKVKDLFGMEPRNHIDPDMAVCLGAAIQGGLITGETEDTVLLDVTPSTLGIEVKGGLFEPVIPRNSTLPTEASEVFTTSETNQRSVYIRVYQGEKQVADRNEFLDEFVLSGIPRAEAGTPQIEVTFRLDLDGILHVTAEDLYSGNKNDIKVKGGTGIAGDKIDEMKERQDKITDISERKKKIKQLKTRGNELVELSDEVLSNENVELDVNVAIQVEDVKEDLEYILSKNDDEIDPEELESLVNSLEEFVGQIGRPTV